MKDRIEARFRPFKVKYLGPGNVRGSRISIRDLRHGKRLVFGYDDAAQGDSSDQAVAKLESLGIKIEALALADFGDGVMLLSSDFSTPMVVKGGGK